MTALGGLAIVAVFSLGTGLLVHWLLGLRRYRLTWRRNDRPLYQRMQAAHMADQVFAYRKANREREWHGN